MKILEKEFSYKRYNYVQLCREGDVAIYKGSPKSGISTTYEVIKIRSHNGYELAGVKFPPSEMYPSTSQWGTFGWTFTTEDAARKKYLSLIPKDVAPVRMRSRVQTAVRKRVR